MSCGKPDHYEPISSKFNPNWPDPHQSGPVPGTEFPAPARKRSPNWGGRRPGAGAPKGNLNAFRHGKNSRYHRQLAELLAQIPEAHEAMVRLARRRQKRERQVQTGASELMAQILQRIGEAVLNPEDNHLENNREIARLIAQAQVLFRENSRQQSRAAAPKRPSIKRREL
jgi:hypothetical protein